MKVLAAVDGSKYGKWAIEWLARIPFVVTPTVRAVHVVDVAGLRAPFMVQPVIAGSEHYIQAEIRRMEAAARAAKKDAAALLSSLRLTGTVTVDRGAVGPTLVKHARRGVGLLVMGSRGL